MGVETHPRAKHSPSLALCVFCSPSPQGLYQPLLLSASGKVEEFSGETKKMSRDMVHPRSNSAPECQQVVTVNSQEKAQLQHQLLQKHVHG